MSIVNIYYNSVELNTLGDFLNNESVSPAYSYRDDPRSFLDLKNQDGATNFQKIILSYSKDEALVNDAGLAYSNRDYNSIKLIPPIVFHIESKNAEVDLFSTQGDLVQDSINVNYFISQRLANLLNNPGYRLINKNVQKGNVKSLHPNLTVFIWSRALSNANNSDFELINVSPFVRSIELNSTKEGASFSIQLPPIKGQYKSEQGWTIDKESFIDYKKEYRSQFSIFGNNNVKEKPLFFLNAISNNDLIFISFSKLEMENETPNRFSVSYSEIKNKVWDCIGFVDQVSEGRSTENLSVDVNVNGRDLTKAIIEDGSYFWATEFGLDGTVRFAGNRDNRIVRRISIGEQGLISYFSVANKSIEYAIRFVIAQLANSGYVPNEIFKEYGEQRSTIFIPTEVEERVTKVESGDSLNNLNIVITNETRRRPKEIIADGIWAITKIIIDPQIANIRLVDNTLFTEQGSLINFFQRIAQEPFVEFYTETIDKFFYFIARRPPYDREQILNAINGINIIDQKEVKSIKKENIYTLPEISVKNLGEFIIDIEKDDVFNYELDFDQTIYTWYKLETRYVLGGRADDLSNLTLLPAIFLPTYTQIWGSRPFNVITNYVNYIPNSGTKDNENYFNSVEQAFFDLSWLIRTHAYLPFTRTGRIIINEDRRIKKGMHIRFKPTGEVFLVDSVSHSMSIGGEIERQTTLQVSRGMVEEFIEGVDVEDVKVNYGKLKKVSYFSLVSTEVDIKSFRKGKIEFTNSSGEQEKAQDPINAVLANWRENEEVINFFLSKRQFNG